MKRLLYLALALLIGGILLLGAGLRRAGKLPLGEFERFVSHFNAEWEYVADPPGNPWKVSKAHRGDCEDYVLTFWVEWVVLHPESSGWIVLVPNHAVGVVAYGDVFYIISVGEGARREASFEDALRRISRVWGNPRGTIRLASGIPWDVDIRADMYARIVRP